jgi:hypothetical protein
MFTIVSSIFQVFLQVFQTHVSNVLFVFRRILQLLHLDVSKLDRVLHLPPRLSTVSPWCQAWNVGGGPTGADGPHVLAGVRSKRDVRDSGAGVRMGGLASGHLGASHTHVSVGP